MKLVEALGLDVNQLEKMMCSGMSEKNINDYGHFDALKKSVDTAKAKSYFEALEGSSIAPFKVNMKVHNLLKGFIFSASL